MNSKSQTQNKSKTLLLILFLLGIFMGAMDTGIVSPAREIIQNFFGVDRNIGIWMITIYTLCYAVSMPITGKLADRYGHKRIYIISISLFTLGSVLCGLSNIAGGFSFLLISRFIQAIGGGGIMPIATTVIGQSFSEEKRGTALGLVGGIFGIATILGPTLGSGILDIAGNSNWGWLFYINLPIGIIIIALSGSIENVQKKSKGKLDILGAILVTIVVASFMYALTNINFFNFIATLKTIKVYPFLIVFIVFLPIMILVELKAQDPMLDMSYFRNRQMCITLILALIVGMSMMGMIFIPQFAENTLKLKAGAGGYMVTLLAVFSGFAAPVSGKLIDKKSAKLVLLLGFFFIASGGLVLGLIAAKSMMTWSVFLGLALIGFGVGFTSGAPLNYLALGAVKDEEGASALATLSLIRSIGITISPGIMIGFVVNAAENLQTELMDTLKTAFQGAMSSMSGMMGPTGSVIGNASKATANASSAMKNATSAMSGGMPDMSSIMDFSNNPKATELFSSLKNSDITTIVNDLNLIFSNLGIPDNISKLIIRSINDSAILIENIFQTVINRGYSNLFIAMAVFSVLGFIAALFLKKNGIKT